MHERESNAQIIMPCAFFLFYPSFKSVTVLAFGHIIQRGKALEVALYIS
jgi:hypothetical protein